MSNRVWIVFAALMIILVGRLVYTALGEVEGIQEPSQPAVSAKDDGAGSLMGEPAP